MSEAISPFWSTAALQIMEMWFDEPGREEEKRKFLRSEHFEKRAPVLALKENIDHFEKRAPVLALKENIDEKPTQTDRDPDFEVLIAKQILAEFGSISPCLLMRKLKCSHSKAYEIYRQVVQVT
jgi:hypothetical protein